MNVMYLHGLEGDANGTKGRYCQSAYQAFSPQMPASAAELAHDHDTCFEACYQVALGAVRAHQPQVIVGSSFGGAITMALMQRGDFKGNAVLLAPAGVKFGLPATLPAECKALIIHDPTDDVVPYVHSQQVLAANEGRCWLWDASSGHRLHAITKDGSLDRAVEWVRAH